jgi:uncharacterized membrane protein YphA (DoxX/SURF4 family)
MTVTTGGPSAAYLKSINFVAPEFMSTFAHIVEWIIVVTLTLGVGARYGALLAFAFVVIALVTARRDLARERYVRTHFDANIQDPTAYDLVIDTSRVHLSEAARFVSGLVQTRLPAVPA